MQVVAALIPLLIILTLVPLIAAAFAIGSARVLKMTLLFRHGLVFGLAIVILGLLARLASWSAGVSIPAVLSVPLGLALDVSFGSWFFASRATGTTEQPVGPRKGALLAGLTIVAMGIVGAGLALLAALGLHALAQAHG